MDLAKNFNKILICVFMQLGPKKIIEDMFTARPTLKYAIETIENVYFYDRFSKDLRKLRNRDSIDVEYSESVFKDSLECFSPFSRIFLNFRDRNSMRVCSGILFE